MRHNAKGNNELKRFEVATHLSIPTGRAAKKISRQPEATPKGTAAYTMKPRPESFRNQPKARLHSESLRIDGTVSKHKNVN
jgi:hypothetical protein